MTRHEQLVEAASGLGINVDGLDERELSLVTLVALGVDTAQPASMVCDPQPIDAHDTAYLVARALRTARFARV